MATFQRGAIVSLILGIGATLFANFVSFPIALLLVRYDFPGRSFLNLMVMSPLLVPSTILGLALYVFLVTVGVGGGPSHYLRTRHDGDAVCDPHSSVEFNSI